MLPPPPAYSSVMLFGTSQSQFSQIWLFLKWFGTKNFKIYLLFGSKFRKTLFTVWLQKFWDLVNKLKNLALFIWKFGTEAFPERKSRVEGKGVVVGVSIARSRMQYKKTTL